MRCCCISPRKRFVVFVALCLALGCGERTGDEMSALRAEVKAARDEVKTLKSKVRHLEKQIAATVPNDEPIRTSKFLSAGSEKDDPFLGPVDSPLLLMQFSDFESSQCAHFAQETLPKIKSEFIDTGKLKFILRDYPLESHPQAQRAAEFAHCAGEQGKYWSAHELLFQNPEKVHAALFSELRSSLKEAEQDKLQKCMVGTKYQKEIEADILDARRLGVKGAPAFFLGKQTEPGLYHGVFIRGAQPFGVFKKQIAALDTSN